MAVFAMDHQDAEELVRRIKAFGDGADDAITEVLHGYGAERIGEEARERIFPSGRRWKGKKKSATAAKPFTSKGSSLTVTVSSKSSYHYLYFPNDGSTTKKHRGQQHFMSEGAEAAMDNIMDRCLARLSEID